MYYKLTNVIKMSEDNEDIFFILLRLKSFLLAMINSPDNCMQDFTYTEEYLERKYPEKAEEILLLLVEHNLTNDCDIAFNEKVHLIFKEIAESYSNNLDLNSILSKYEIKTLNTETKDSELERLRIEKEQKIKRIVLTLFQVAKIWSSHNDIDNTIDNFSFLEDIELIRPEEMKRLSELDKSSQASFKTIKELTSTYITAMIDYLFRYGGDFTLKEFSENLEELNKLITEKYNELFNSSGLKDV